MSIKIRQFLPFAIIITAFCGLTYVAGQQILRLSANDPQIQLSQDLALKLEHGENIATLLTPPQIDISTSLNTYIIVVAESGETIVSNAFLNGKLPVPPRGVFEYTKTHHQDRITWQPQPGVRSSIVVTAYNGSQPGYVVVGRSLKEIEKREDQLFQIVALAWIVTISTTFISSFLIQNRHKK